MPISPMLDDQQMAVSEPSRPFLSNPHCWECTGIRMSRARVLWLTTSELEQVWWCDGCTRIYSHPQIDMLTRLSSDDEVDFDCHLDRFDNEREEEYYIDDGEEVFAIPEWPTGGSVSDAVLDGGPEQEVRRVHNERQNDTNQREHSTDYVAYDWRETADSLLFAEAEAAAADQPEEVSPEGEESRGTSQDSDTIETSNYIVQLQQRLDQARQYREEEEDRLRAIYRAALDRRQDYARWYTDNP